MPDQITAWFPLPDLPRLPCGIELEGGPEQVTVRVVYSFYGSDRDVLITFQAEVYGCFSDLSSPRVFVPDDYPRVAGPNQSAHLWPLMEVMESSWLQAHRERLWMPEVDYRHLRIVSDDGSFDALTSGNPSSRWVAARS
jgi:hypothetical protein